jgi:photosystem II stability/assembly factor-like uncharacterized protein
MRQFRFLHGALRSSRPAQAPLLVCGLAALLGWATVAPLHAGSGFWSSLGPDGGPVGAVAVDPSNPRVVYAGSTQGGVWKSLDGGATWSRASRGLTDYRMVALAIDPRHPSILYAAALTGVWKSVDAAAIWHATPFPPQNLGFTAVSSLLIDPARPGTIYAADFFEIYASNDGGNSWAYLHEDVDGFGIQLAADPVYGNLFAVVSRETTGLGLLVSADGGASWSDITGDIPALPAFVDVIFALQLAVDPNPPGAAFFAFEYNSTSPGIHGTATFRSVDGGRTWNHAGPGGAPIAVGPAHRIYAAGYRSVDGGATWTPTGAPPDMLVTLTAGPSPDLVYAGAQDRGVLRSVDGARSWQIADRGLRASTVAAVAVDPGDPARLYAVVPGQGFFVSRNTGQRWRQAGAGLPTDVTSLQYSTLAIDPADSAVLYLAWNGGFGGFSRSTDGGATFTTLPPAGESCFAVFSFVIAPGTPSTLYASGGLQHTCDTLKPPDCTVFQSSDGGGTWSCLDVNAASVTLAPSSPGTLYAIGPMPFGQFGTQPLYASSDAGASWRTVDANLPGGPFGIIDLLVDPSDARRLFATGFGSTLWRSVDGGAHWQESDGGLPGQRARPLRLAFDPRDPALLYAGAEDLGVYRTSNGGRTWQPLLSGLPPLISEDMGPDSYSQLVADPQRSGTLYLATAIDGLLTYESP